jgi:methylated-DNA-[protein]-cysteine S-methyltransferase
MTLATESSVPLSRAVSLDRFDAIVQLPFGSVGVRTQGEFVERIEFLPFDVRCMAATNAVAQRAIDQLCAYCERSERPIDLPLLIDGTPFQRSVWREIAGIPVGATRTYGEIAHRLHGSPRAVGQACGDNRLPLAIPCHRVVSSTGIGGFAHRRGGAYQRIKRWLLTHEAGAELRLT